MGAVLGIKIRNTEEILLFLDQLELTYAGPTPSLIGL